MCYCRKALKCLSADTTHLLTASKKLFRSLYIMCFCFSIDLFPFSTLHKSPSLRIPFREDWAERNLISFSPSQHRITAASFKLQLSEVAEETETCFLGFYCWHYLLYSWAFFRVNPLKRKIISLSIMKVAHFVVCDESFPYKNKWNYLSLIKS